MITTFDTVIMHYLDASMWAVSPASALPKAARVCFNWAGVGQGGAGPEAELAASDWSTWPGQTLELALGTTMAASLSSKTLELLPLGRIPSLRS